MRKLGSRIHFSHLPNSLLSTLSFSAGLEGVPQVCFLLPHFMLFFSWALSAVCCFCHVFPEICTESSSFMIIPFHYSLFPVHQFNTVFNFLRTHISYSLIFVLISANKCIKHISAEGSSPGSPGWQGATGGSSHAGCFCLRSMAQPPLPVINRPQCVPEGGAACRLSYQEQGWPPGCGEALPGAQDSNGVYPGPLILTRSHDG